MLERSCTWTHEQLLVLRGHDEYVKDVVFSPDGTLLGRWTA
jgi:WD40 repeat protein